ncbi:pyroglutamyl-peptidase 1 [Ceratobasidium sp. AG-Ba]|nr:pyroglutamyl-peptidase 1 [Ceratobasidium sp. AG-Ba]
MIFRVLLTGFGPFQGISNNPSWQAVSALQNQMLEFSSGGGTVEAHVSAFEMPVTYDAVMKNMPAFHSGQYDLVIHVGVNPNVQARILVESMACSSGYHFPDANNQLLDQAAFEAEYGSSGEVLYTSIYVTGLVNHLSSKYYKNVS